MLQIEWYKKKGWIQSNNLIVLMFIVIIVKVKIKRVRYYRLEDQKDSKRNTKIYRKSISLVGIYIK